MPILGLYANANLCNLVNTSINPVPKWCNGSINVVLALNYVPQNSQTNSYYSRLEPLSGT